MYDFDNSWSARSKRLKAKFEQEIGQKPLTQRQTRNLIYMAKNIASKMRQTLNEQSIPNTETIARNSQERASMFFLYHRDYCGESMRLYNQHQKEALEALTDTTNPLAVSAYAKAILCLMKAATNPEELEALNLDRKVDHRWLGRLANNFIRAGFEDAAMDRAKDHTQHLRKTKHRRANKAT